MKSLLSAQEQPVANDPEPNFSKRLYVSSILFAARENDRWRCGAGFRLGLSNFDSWACSGSGFSSCDTIVAASMLTLAGSASFDGAIFGFFALCSESPLTFLFFDLAASSGWGLLGCGEDFGFLSLSCMRTFTGRLTPRVLDLFGFCWSRHKLSRTCPQTRSSSTTGQRRESMFGFRTLLLRKVTLIKLLYNYY